MLDHQIDAAVAALISWGAMFERFGESAKRALLLSERVAFREGSGVVEPGHIGFALLSVIPDVFRSLGVPAERLLIEGIASEYHVINFSHAAKRSLAYAAHECERANERLISPIHLLIGIFREQPTAVFSGSDFSLNVRSLRVLEQAGR